MAKKIIKSDFEDIVNDINESSEYDFEGEFDDIEIEGPKHGKKSGWGHKLFFAVVGIVFVFCVVSLILWNRGVKIIIDPNEDTSEFDTEPNDYIQPMTSNLLEGKVDDGVMTILTLGNSPFADNGSDNYLAAAIAEKYNAQIINESVPDTYQCRRNAIGDDSDSDDTNSLYDVTKRLVDGDMSNVDCVVISYDLSDYIDHRNIYNPYDEDDVTTFCGALSASIKLIQEKYPYIRIIVLSAPACGKTIDDYYVDGTIVDLANGTLNDYIGQEVATCATRGVSFIDLYFGVINVDTRDEYLVDDYHINEAGARAVADRMYKLIKLN